MPEFFEAGLSIEEEAWTMGGMPGWPGEETFEPAYPPPTPITPRPLPPRPPAPKPAAGLPVMLPAVVTPSIAPPGAETEDITFNGVGPLAAMPLDEYAIPTAVAAMASPLAIAPVIAGLMSLGFFKALLARFGPVVVKMMVGAAAFAGFMKLFGGGASDEVQLPIKPGEGKKRKRYSIGHNPRVRTLQKVSRHCMSMLKKHRKVIDEFLPPKRRALPASALARTYLSTAERKALS